MSANIDIDEIFAQAGAIKSVGPLTAINQLRGYFTIEGEKKKVGVFFTLTPENNPLVQQLNLRLFD